MVWGSWRQALSFIPSGRTSTRESRPKGRVNQSKNNSCDHGWHSILNPSIWESPLFSRKSAPWTLGPLSLSHSLSLSFSLAQNTVLAGTTVVPLFSIEHSACRVWAIPSRERWYNLLTRLPQSCSDWIACAQTRPPQTLPAECDSMDRSRVLQYLFNKIHAAEVQLTKRQGISLIFSKAQERLNRSRHLEPIASASHIESLELQDLGNLRGTYYSSSNKAIK